MSKKELSYERKLELLRNLIRDLGRFLTRVLDGEQRQAEIRKLNLLPLTQRCTNLLDASQLKSAVVSILDGLSVLEQRLQHLPCTVAEGKSNRKVSFFGTLLRDSLRELQ